MKILLASSSSGSRGGGEICLLYLGRALALRGHEVTLWASDHARMDELAAGFVAIGRVIRAPYINTYERRGRSIASYLDRATAHRVGRQWQALAPDVVHVNKQNLEDGLDLLRAANGSGLPTVSMIHITQTAAYLRATFASLRDLVARRALRRFSGLFVTTPGNRQRELTKFIGTARQVRSVYNGVPIPDLSVRRAARIATRRELGIHENELLFIAVGRMVSQKRPLLFLEIAKRISRESPEAKFLWVGDGPLTSEWDSWLAANCLPQFARRLPWQRDVASFLAAADVFLHVAEFEGLAFAILEALASGLPCAITPNLLAEMPFLDSDNSISLCKDGTWVALLRDRVRLARLGEAARRLAEERFSFEKMAGNYEALYCEVIEQYR